MKNSKRLLALAVSAAIAAPMAAHATNGMNLEAYGPIAGGMGGASMAYDNGTAAMMNNPATLGLMAEGNRIDAAVGLLGPDVAAKAPAMMGGAEATSGGDSYVMPAIGWAHRKDKLTYGVGVFSQGGMGTEYDKNTWMAAGTTQDARSELGVGRLMAPLAYNVNEKLVVGGSIDYVWGGLDMKMPLPIFNPMSGTATAGTFADFFPAFGGQQVLGEATMTAGLQGQLQAAIGGGVDTVAINFSDSSDFTQEASGTGFGGKIGMTYKVNSQVTMGAAYHLKTSMSDWEGDATMDMYAGGNAAGSVPGKITIKDFQWPATIAAGVAFNSNEKWMVAADVKILQWSDTMKNFNMVYTTGGESADITFYQNWDDQTVISLGGSYMVNDAFTVRGGANISSNPVPDEYVNPLFPAIVENHYMAGFGYAFNQASDLNFSLTYAPEVSVTNTNTQVGITHSQMNWQMMYSHKF